MNRLPTGRVLGFLLRLHVGAVILFLFIPILVMVIFSLDNSPIPIYPIDDPTFRWYKEVVGPRAEDYFHPLLNSMRVAFLTSILATTLGGLAAFGLVRYRFAGDEVYPYILVLPALVPPIVTGYGLLILLRQVLDITLSLYTIVLGHTVLTLPVAAFVISIKLGPERELERAARDLGANYLQMFKEITAPMIAPALIASFMISFAISLGESAMVFLVRGRGSLLPIEIQSRIATQFSPRVNAISTLAVLITIGVLAIAELLRQRF